MTKISQQEFLLALDLPGETTEHFDDAGGDWSIADYFSYEDGPIWGLVRDPCLWALVRLICLLFAPFVVLWCIHRLYPASLATKQAKLGLFKGTCSDHSDDGKMALFSSIALNAISGLASATIERKEKEGLGTKGGTRSSISRVSTSDSIAFGVAIAFTSIMMNDRMYILEYTRPNMIALHLFVIYVGIKRFGATTALRKALPVTLVSLALMLSKCRDLDMPTFEAGLYYDNSNHYVSNIIKEWPIEKRTYIPSPWILTGDARTGLPFLINTIPKQDYIRR